jgi:hypothetical protein
MGPIPEGEYWLGKLGATPPHNPPRIPIWPKATTNTYGRFAFEFHPGSTPRSSRGCIALDRPDYDRFTKFYSIDNRGSLTVLDWLNILP